MAGIEMDSAMKVVPAGNGAGYSVVTGSVNDPQGAADIGANIAKSLTEA